MTPAAARIIPKGLLTESALAWVVTSKYMDALPLYRQAALLGRFGGDLSRNTLAASLIKVGEAVQPVINLLRDHLLDADLVHADETTIQVLKEPGKKAQTKSYLWAQATGSGPPIRLFGYARGRGAAHAETLYAGIKRGAALMSDGYEAYGGVAEANGLSHLGCWAHCRRYFVEAEAVIPKTARSPEQPATQFIAAIAELYAVEARARDLTLEQRHALRQEYSQPILVKIEAMLLKHLHAVVPGSLLGRALHYLSAQWPKLIRYADNGLWPIDNNLCENAIRPFVIGRRNCCSPIRSPVHTPVRISTRSSKTARPTASILTLTSSASSGNSPPRKPLMTSSDCCLGVWLMQTEHESLRLNRLRQSRPQ